MHCKNSLFCSYNGKYIAKTPFSVVTAANMLKNLPFLQLQWQMHHKNSLSCSGKCITKTPFPAGYSSKRIAKTPFPAVTVAKALQKLLVALLVVTKSLKMARDKPHTHEEMEQMKRKAAQRKAVVDATIKEKAAKPIADQSGNSPAKANKKDSSSIRLDATSVAVAQSSKHSASKPNQFVNKSNYQIRQI